MNSNEFRQTKINALLCHKITTSIAYTSKIDDIFVIRYFLLCSTFKYVRVSE